MTDLEDATRRLQQTLESVEGEIRRRSGMGLEWGMDPAFLQDSNGRYVLLDAQTALVNGLAALRAMR